MNDTAHLSCAFPDSALGVADRLGDMARAAGLVAWTHPRSPGEWEIRFVGEAQQLRGFAAKLGFTNVDDAIQFTTGAG